MLRKILEIALLFAALTGFAIGVVILSLKIVFPEQKLKKLFSDGIYGYTSRESNFKSIKWGLNGIDIEGASISAKHDFKKGTFLTVEKVNYLPVFLSGNKAGLLKLDSPVVLVEYIPGSFDIRLSSAVERVFGNTNSKAKYFSFFGLNVVNGEIEFLNKKTGRKDVLIKNIQVSLKEGQSLGLFECGLNADIVSGSQTLGITADLLIDYKASAVSFSNAKIQSQQAGLITVSGRINDISSANNTAYDFNLKGDRRVLDKIFELLPGELACLQYGAKDKVDINITSVSGKLKILDNLYER